MDRKQISDQRRNSYVMTLPSLGVEAGTIFGYGGNLTFRDQWQTVGGMFALAETGDTVILYIEMDGEIQHLSALSYSGVGKWTAPGLSADQYGTADSALPESLKSVGAVSLPHFENYMYMGPVEGKTFFLQGSIQNVSNWEGSNTNRMEAPMQVFRAEHPPTTESTPNSTNTTGTTSTPNSTGTISSNSTGMNPSNIFVHNIDTQGLVDDDSGQVHPLKLQTPPPQLQVPYTGTKPLTFGWLLLSRW